jgi:hypothetical protein
MGRFPSDALDFGRSCEHGFGDALMDEVSSAAERSGPERTHSRRLTLAVRLTGASELLQAAGTVRRTRSHRAGARVFVRWDNEGPLAERARSGVRGTAPCDSGWRSATATCGPVPALGGVPVSGAPCRTSSERRTSVSTMKAVGGSAKYAGPLPRSRLGLGERGHWD